ncbi:Fc.00g051820.m01.CDS01 [Cosmosporella sp. VM-42]
MAEAHLRDGEVTPIAQLNPDISEQKSRVVSGVITIIWPFSIVTKSIAFILAEPDFRLRRDKGQVRLRFHGAVGKAIADSGIGGGDEIRMSLDRVKWEKNEMQTQLAGSTLEWQLEFTNRLLLSIQRADEEVVRVIDVDVPEAETNGTTDNTGLIDEQPSNGDLSILQPQSPEFSVPAKRPAASTLEPQEFASPAFIKRARVSYGSLFEGGFDIFEEKAAAKKSKSRRRSRFSLPANAWRYNSQSPSPELEEEPEPEVEHEEVRETGDELPEQAEAVDVPMLTPPRPAMVDEGCQTIEVDFTPMASVQVSAEARPGTGFPLATPTPLPRTRPSDMGHALIGNPLNLTHLDSPTDFLARSHGHMDPAFGYGLNVAPSQPILYPPGTDLFPASRSEDVATDHGNYLPRAEDYPATFLDDNVITPTGMNAHPSIHSQDGSIEPQAMEHPDLNFEPDSQFYPPFPEESLQAPHGAWGTTQFTAVNALNHPVEAIDSPPPRDQTLAVEPSSPVASVDTEGSHGPQDEDMNDRGRVTTADEDAGSASEVEGQYKEGGDRPGDDYDLRNYDRAHDDDDDVPSSEESVAPNPDDVEAQMINPDEEDVEEEEAEGCEDEPDDHRYEDRQYGEDEEQEYYSDEEGYTDEEEETDDEQERSPSPPPAPREPVFISLLSDSEDEDEDASEPPPARIPDAIRHSAPEYAKEPELEPEQERESEVESESVSDLLSEPEDDLEQAVWQEEAGGLEEAPETREAEPESTASDHPAKPIELDTVGDTMEMDHEEDMIAEETQRPGLEPASEPPSGDHMEIDGHQSPEPSGLPQDTAVDMQATQEATPEATREEALPASISIDRGDPAYEDPEAPKEVVFVSTDVPTTGRTATQQESNGDDKVEDDQVQDEMQATEEVHVASAEVVTLSGDVMQVDTTRVQESDHATGMGPDVTNRTTDVAQVISGTMAEDTANSVPGHEGAMNLVQMAAGVLVTPGSDPEHPSTSNVLDQGRPQGQEITEAREAQGSGPARSPDATALQAPSSPSQLVTSDEHRPLEEAQAAQTGDGEDVSKTTNKDQQMTANAPFSPPLTQSFQKDTDEALLSQVSTSMSTQDENAHLPTPYDTQPDTDMRAHYPAEQQADALEDDGDVGPDDQLMAEFLQHSPVRPESMQPVNPAAAGTSPTQRKSGREHNEEKFAEDGQGSDDTVIMVKSLPKLRSHGHRSTRSSDLTKASHPDPSVLLAKSSAPPPHEDDAIDNSSPGTLRVTRSRPDPSDPSVALAKASTNAEEAKGTSNSPPGTLRVTRSNKQDLTDPSIPLAKVKAAATPSSRQTRRQQTPELPHRETRASSLKLQRGTTPDTVVAASTLLKSPSVAESTAAAEDEGVGAVKLQLVKSLRTSLPDYLSLKTLRNHLGKTANILAVATATPAQPQRPKGGPRDYMMSLNLVDPSAAPTTVVVANLFRPHQQALPIVHTGDVVLLRRVNVVSMKGRGFGVRTVDASSWAIFEKANMEMLPQIKGPPVDDLSDEEVGYAEGLKKWWTLLDEKSMEKIDKASRKLSEAGKE